MRRWAGRASLVLVLVLLSGLAGAQEPSRPQSRVVVQLSDTTVTGSATLIREANGARTALNCTNNSAVVNVRWGSSAVAAASGQRFKAGAAIEITGTYAVYMISEDADVAVSCSEESR